MRKYALRRVPTRTVIGFSIYAVVCDCRFIMAGGRASALKKHKQKVLNANRNKRWSNLSMSTPSHHLDHSYCNGSGPDVAEEFEPEAEVTSDEPEVSGWRVGRRIVELGTLADNLRSCFFCTEPLHLIDCVGETKMGLAQVLRVKCRQCKGTNDVPTGSRHTTQRGGKAWDVNTKLAAGMVNGGFGESHVNSLLAALNIPGICRKSLKDREREIATELVNMAQESCNQSLKDEVEKSSGDLSASFDGAWQKRGTGRAYNSLTGKYILKQFKGHASLIGDKSKKCIAFAVKSKKCRICESAKAKEITPRKHNCIKNWSGSAKSMEPAMACEMLQGVIDQGHKINTLVMDNDSTTISRVKATVDPDITKKSDSNHTKKGFTGNLIDLSNTHKVLKNQKVRQHIERCFMYCIRQAGEDSEKLSNDLEKIVPHLYGDHTECGSWCRSEKNGYKPKNLPYGKPLSNVPLKDALENLLRKYISKADQLVSMGSTQVNESLNNMVSSKAPKRLFYGGSESLQTRLSATVCQKNEGYSYITQLNERLAMSPGRFTIKHTQSLESKLKMKRLSQSSRSSKRRRLELKIQRAAKDTTQSVLEADTYSSKIGLEEDVDLEDISLDIPSVLPSNSPYVYFDLETTGLARTSDIIQLAAVHNDKELNLYVSPKSQISPEASAVTGITYIGKVMKHNNEIVQCIEPRDAYILFLDFLESFERKPILVGHNIQVFDLPVLMNQLVKFDMLDRFKESVLGFIDTLKLSKKVFDKTDVSNYKQSTLVTTLLGIGYDAHNALADVKALRSLFEQKLSSQCGPDDMFTVHYYAARASLDPLLKDKIISPVIHKKLISNSLSLQRLRLIHRRDPHNGIRNVFSERVNSQTRISKSNAVINKIVDYLNR
ncbi:hypothetical protein FSP39_015740 [Pinctada imbricata]|uniref:Exonuclease domain-containing protein n=1 Tax=Pinctada imbricata TaxID=66713 RepID=A0AA88XSM9_PINIB|nr:hypothetical protein FSP39_015740 [Pinctada imbricata]